ncbi:MAG: tetratricopeptide repeat protein [Acidobacteriaceae bacterium]
MRLSAILLICLLCAFPVKAEEAAAQQIAQAYQLWRSGQAKAAIAILEPLLQPGTRFADERSLGMAWNVLGSSYFDVERHDEARRAYQHAMELLRALPDERAQYASAIDNLGTVEQSLGQHQAAKALCQKAQQIYEQVGSMNGIVVASTNLAVIAYGQTDFKAARRYLEKAFEAAPHTMQMREDDWAALQLMKGALALHDRRNEEAMSAIQQAIERWTRAYGPKYFMLADGYLLLARALASSGDRAKAMVYAKHGMTLAEEVLGANTIGYLNAEAAYARVLGTCGEKHESKRLGKEASGALAALEQRMCSGCTIDANGFR